MGVGLLLTTPSTRKIFFNFFLTYIHTTCHHKRMEIDDDGNVYDTPKKKPLEASTVKHTIDELPPLDLNEATPVLLDKAIRAARLSDDPKIIIPVLDALMKRGHAEADKAKMHDIRVVMSLLTADQLDRLERMTHNNA